MDFVQESTAVDIKDWKEWMNKYVDRNSKLYKQFELMLTHIPNENIIATELSFKTPYNIWIEMLRSPNIVVKDYGKVNNNNNNNNKSNIFNIFHKKKQNTKKVIMLDNTIIAIIDKVDNKYKYIAITDDCRLKIMREYSSYFY